MLLNANCSFIKSKSLFKQFFMHVLFYVCVIQCKKYLFKIFFTYCIFVSTYSSIQVFHKVLDRMLETGVADYVITAAVTLATSLLLCCNRQPCAAVIPHTQTCCYSPVTQEQSRLTKRKLEVVSTAKNFLFRLKTVTLLVSACFLKH